MALQIRAGRYIGQILVDGGLVSCRDLEFALDEQRHTNELLGQVLTRMGVVDPADLKVALSVQEHLGSLEDAVKAAAGVRQMLGAMLLQAGRISEEQLEEAIAEQKEGGGMLGEILVRRGYLTERQLNALLDFQKVQEEAPSVTSPLRLGDILVSSGYLTRKQLDSALDKQSVSRKKLGEVLIEEGYVLPQQIRHGIGLQQKLLTAILVGILALAAVPETEAEAATRSSGAQLRVSATVLPFANLKVHNQSSILIITEGDIARGYVDVTGGSSIEVRSNSRDGYFLSFECFDSTFKEVQVDGLGKSALLGSGTGLVPMPMQGKLVRVELNYRFVLSDDVKPGAYPWPLMLSVIPM